MAMMRTAGCHNYGRALSGLLAAPVGVFSSRPHWRPWLQLNEALSEITAVRLGSCHVGWVLEKLGKKDGRGLSESMPLLPRRALVLLEEVLLDLQEQCQRYLPSREEERVARVCHYIQTHLNEPVGVDECAQLFDCPHPYVCL